MRPGSAPTALRTHCFSFTYFAIARPHITSRKEMAGWRKHFSPVRVSQDSHTCAYNHSTCAYRGDYAVSRPSSEQCTPYISNAIVEADLCGRRSYTSRMTSLTSGAGLSMGSTTRRRQSIGSKPKMRMRKLVSRNSKKTRLRKASTRRKAGKHSIGSYYRMFHYLCRS